jgi:hypothetical protein
MFKQLKPPIVFDLFSVFLKLKYLNDKAADHIFDKILDVWL